MRILKYTLLAVALLLSLAVVLTLIQAAVLRFHNPDRTAWMRMRMRQARAQGKELSIKHTWVKLSEMPRVVPMAVIAAEDDGFYRHSGFDWDAMKKAMRRNEKSGRIKRGGSTITQQLAKNLYLSPSRSYWRKGREAAITVALELLLPKARILELYLNCIEFGPGIFGIEAASKYHFGIPARRLSTEQACRLAAIIPSPLRYKPYGPYVSRRAAVLQRIVSGVPRITAEQSEPDVQETPQE